MNDCPNKTFPSGEALCVLFLEMLHSERGAATATREAYATDLRDWRSFLTKKALQEASAADIQDYLAHLFRKQLNGKTLARRLSSLRQFYGFLKGERWIQKDPTHSISSPKTAFSLPYVLQESEVSLLLEEAQNNKTPEGIRLWAFLETLYATGMRISELVTLPLTAFANRETSDHPLTGRVLYVLGKGGKERIIPLTPPALQALGLYLNVRPLFIPPLQKTNPFLFPSTARQKHITRQRVGQLLKELALKAGLPFDKISPHSLRHAFATHLLHHGADLISVQRLLGHTDVGTTQIYTHVLREHLSQLVMRYHPLATRHEG